MLDGIFTGLQTAIIPTNLLMVVLGCFVGTFIGMLPGLGPISAIARTIAWSIGSSMMSLTNMPSILMKSTGSVFR